MYITESRYNLKPSNPHHGHLHVIVYWNTLREWLPSQLTLRSLPFVYLHLVFHGVVQADLEQQHSLLWGIHKECFHFSSSVSNSEFSMCWVVLSASSFLPHLSCLIFPVWSLRCPVVFWNWECMWWWTNASTEFLTTKLRAAKWKSMDRSDVTQNECYQLYMWWIIQMYTCRCYILH